MDHLAHRETEYLVFQELPQPEKKTRLWVVRSRRWADVLGYIRWHGPWRQYVLSTSGALFNRGCLADVDKFLEDAQKDWRERKKAGTV